MSCPKCGKYSISKEKTIRGWSGDYICNYCGYSDDKEAFDKETVTDVDTKCAKSDVGKNKK